MTPSAEMRAHCCGLMREVSDLYFTTLDEHGLPETRCMFNLRCAERFPTLQPLFVGHDEDLMTYFSTNTSSSKVRELRDNPRVAVYYCQPDRIRGFMLRGRVDILEDPALKHALWQRGWEVYYPQGPDDPDYTVLRLLPNFVKGWWQGRPFAFSLPLEGPR